MKSIKKRIWCEDISPLFKSIKSHKHNGKLIEINGVSYERIGDDMLYNLKTSRIENLVSLS